MKKNPTKQPGNTPSAPLERPRAQHPRAPSHFKANESSHLSPSRLRTSLEQGFLKQREASLPAPERAWVQKLENETLNYCLFLEKPKIGARWRGDATCRQGTQLGNHTATLGRDSLWDLQQMRCPLSTKRPLMNQKLSDNACGLD